MDQTLSLDTWARVCLQKATVDRDTKSSYGSQVIYPCSLCYYALDACSEFLITNQKSNNNKEGIYLGLPSHLKTSDTSALREVDDDDAKDKRMHGINNPVYISCNGLHNASYSPLSRSPSARSCLSSYSSMAATPVEEHIPAIYTQHSHEQQSREHGNIDSMIYTGTNNESNCNEDANQCASNPTPDVSSDNSFSRITSLSPISTTNMIVSSNISSSEHQVSCNDFSSSTTFNSNSEANINPENTENETLLAEPVINIDTDIPEDNDCEIFDQYMREIYATNIEETSENELTETSEVFNTEIIKLTCYEINHKNCLPFTNHRDSNQHDAFEISFQNTGCKDNTY